MLVAGAGALFLYIFYEEAKTAAITRLNQEQMIYARQASQGIEDFFATWTRSLSALTKTGEDVAIYPFAPT